MHKVDPVVLITTAINPDPKIPFLTMSAPEIRSISTKASIFFGLVRDLRSS